MAQDSLQCLAQLASMHGPIFPDESAQVSYLAHLVEGLLSMINGSVCHFARKLNIQNSTQLSSGLSVLWSKSCYRYLFNWFKSRQWHGYMDGNVDVSDHWLVSSAMTDFEMKYLNKNQLDFRGSRYRSSCFRVEPLSGQNVIFSQFKHVCIPNIIRVLHFHLSTFILSLFAFYIFIQLIALLCSIAAPRRHQPDRTRPFSHRMRRCSVNTSTPVH